MKLSPLMGQKRMVSHATPYLEAKDELRETENRFNVGQGNPLSNALERHMEPQIRQNKIETQKVKDDIKKDVFGSVDRPPIIEEFVEVGKISTKIPIWITRPGRMSSC